MTIDEIESKHALLVVGYEGMKPGAKVKYHIQITLQAIIDELLEMEDYVEHYSANASKTLSSRANELQQKLDEIKTQLS